MKYIYSTMLVFAVLALFLAIPTNNILMIPSIVSFIGWIILLFGKIQKKLSARVKIYLSGIIIDTEVTISNEFSDIKNFNAFVSYLEKIDKNLYHTEKLARKIEGSYEVQLVDKKGRVLKFDVDEYYNHDSETVSAILKFQPIQNRHFTIIEYAKRIGSFINEIARENSIPQSNMRTDILINYYKNNNPVLKELAKSGKEIKMSASGKDYEMSNNYIKLDCSSDEFKDRLSEVLLGDLDK